MTLPVIALLRLCLPAFYRAFYTVHVYAQRFADVYYPDAHPCLRTFPLTFTVPGCWLRLPDLAFGYGCLIYRVGYPTLLCLPTFPVAPVDLPYGYWFTTPPHPVTFTYILPRWLLVAFCRTPAHLRTVTLRLPVGSPFFIGRCTFTTCGSPHVYLQRDVALTRFPAFTPFAGSRAYTAGI